MPTMNDISHDVHYSLFKGEPGTRKSTSALTYPKPQYWFSFDKKMKNLLLPMKRWNVDPKEIHFDDYDDWSKASAKLKEFQTNRIPYKTVIIDSITSCADNMLRQVLLAKSGQTRSSGSAAGKTIGGIPTNEIEDFNAEAAGLTELISLTKDIHTYHKIDVILIAHVIRRDNRALDGTTNVTRTLVTAGKAPAAKIPAYCQEIYHFGKEKGVFEGEAGDYIIQTANAGDDYALTGMNLPKLIKIGDDNLYEKYILPAIKKMNPSEENKGNIL